MTFPTISTCTSYSTILFSGLKSTEETVNNDEDGYSISVHEDDGPSSIADTRPKEDKEQYTATAITSSSPSPGASSSLSLTALESAQTIGYRASMFIVSILFGLILVLPILQEAGLNIGSSSDEGSELFGGPFNIAFVVGTISACLLSPGTKTKNNVDGDNNNDNNDTLLSSSSRTLLQAAAIVVGVTSQPFYGLSALFLREIAYFGIAYKVEAVVGLVSILFNTTAGTVFFLLDNNDGGGSSSSSISNIFNTNNNDILNAVTCLAFAIMVFGKFLEPLTEDWIQNESEFLSKDRME